MSPRVNANINVLALHLRLEWTRLLQSARMAPRSHHADAQLNTATCHHRPDPTTPTACRQWYYYYLTDEGIEYLRQYLHLPSETVPLTHKKPAGTTRPTGAPERAGAGGDRRGGFGERRFGDKAGAPDGFRPRFGGAAGGDGEYRRRAPAAAPPA